VFGIIGVLGGWCMFGVPCLIAVITGHAALKEPAPASTAATAWPWPV